jgi:hypothetical protein
MKTKFELGQTVITPSALALLDFTDIIPALRRHVSGDWGNVDPEDAAENEIALVEGLRILSAYTSSSNQIFWIITEADRSCTTVLLPEDY